MTVAERFMQGLELNRLDLFHDVDPATISYLLEECREVRIPAGATLLDPGEPNDSVYIVLSGALTVHHGSPDGKLISKVGPGACAGEMSMIEGAVPSAYVIATEDCELLCIKHETLWALINTSHAAARNLVMILLHRTQADKQFMRERSIIMRQYHRRALTDPLTDLYNRYGMEKFFPRALERCQKDGTPATQIVLDVDHFRDFNNEYGHLAGDSVLMAVADRIQGGFRPTDLMARYGGDEFTVLLPDTDVQLGESIAESVRRSIGSWQSEERDGMRVSVSVGLAGMQPRDTVKDLFGRADAALYRAKQAGRNCVSR